jgi:hypothetical protein
MGPREARITCSATRSTKKGGHLPLLAGFGTTLFYGDLAIALGVLGVGVLLTSGWLLVFFWTTTCSALFAMLPTFRDAMIDPLDPRISTGTSMTPGRPT